MKPQTKNADLLFTVDNPCCLIFRRPFWNSLHNPPSSTQLCHKTSSDTVQNKRENGIIICMFYKFSH